MAIVFACPLSVDAYAAFGPDIEVPRPDCPDCSEAMSFWGFYRRDLRVGAIVKLLVRRARCGRCATSHALLPDFVAHGRLDGVEVIGAGLKAMAAGASDATVARSGGVHHSTVRDWRRRGEARAELLTAGFCAATVALGDLVPRLAVTRVLESLTGAVGAAVRAARHRFGALGTDWRIANRIIGGHLLTTTMDPPWLAS
jgi:hypothetical protein